MTSHLRPARHFTPRSTWMNDPNGLVYLDGVYHLFFQNNPEGLDWGNMSWGHATSPDLLTWTEHDVTLRFSEQEALFSGSVVVDHGNSSGLGEGDTRRSSPSTPATTSPGRRAQAPRRSRWPGARTGGMTWRRHPGNPVLCRQSADFRDPKVFRHPTGWVMVAVEAVHRQVVLYRSDDLLEWEHL